MICTFIVCEAGKFSESSALKLANKHIYNSPGGELPLFFPLAKRVTEMTELIILVHKKANKSGVI